MRLARPTSDSVAFQPFGWFWHYFTIWRNSFNQVWLRLVVIDHNWFMESNRPFWGKKRTILRGIFWEFSWDILSIKVWLLKKQKSTKSKIIFHLAVMEWNFSVLCYAVIWLNNEYVFGLRISNMLQFQIIFNEIIQTFLRSVSSGHMYHLNFKLQ